MFSQIYEWVQIASMVCAIASAIAALTPTPKDDVIIGKIYKVVDLLALNIGKAKDNGRDKI